MYLTFLVLLVLLLAVGPEAGALSGSLLLVGPATVALSFPPVYQRLPRIVRDVLRAAAGALLALALVALLRGEWLLGGGNLLVFSVFFGVYSRVRRRIRASSCDDCNELQEGLVCSGYALQAQLIRRFQEHLTDLLEKRLHERYKTALLHDSTQRQTGP